MRILALLPAVLAAPLLLASCGLVHLPGSTDCPTANAPADGGPPGCPCEPPELGDSCDVPPPAFGLGPTCTYGTDQLPGCRQSFSCAQGEWQLFDPLRVGSCPETRECPATRPTNGAACMHERDVCGYANSTICICVFTGWSCFKPMPGCPDAIPNAGTPCPMEMELEKVGCEYTNACPLAGAVCLGGVWLWETGSGC